MVVIPETKPMEGSPVICKRCNISEATLKNRADDICEKCFMHYVTTKAVKRMETYRVRGSTSKAPKKLLLPISFGPSSTCLLHILDNQLRAQLDRMGRTSYELIVVHIRPAATSSQDQDSLLRNLKMRFPRHEYISKGLEESLDLKMIDWDVLELGNIVKINPALPNKERFQLVLDSLPSSTSRADISSTLLLRLLVSTAKENHCDSILFGDSTTRLAEKTLTETAKGRGFSLPWQVSDGMSPYKVNFHYPQRDLLKQELLTFSSLTTPPLSDLIIYQSPSTQVSASSKSTTIDDLMAQYFESVEVNYPSIVANVVRTSSKLNAPSSRQLSAECNLCGLPVTDGTDGINGWSGDQSSNARSRPTDLNNGILCYGCARSINR